MKKYFLFLMALALCLNVVGQRPIVLRSADKAVCVSSDYHQLRASFSFSTIEAEQVDTQRGTFSWLSMANTVIGGNEGDPQIPVVNELIAVPFGAHPTIRVTGFSTTDYSLEDYDIGTLIPRQPSLRKDQKPEDVPFVYNDAAYQTRGLRSEPQAVVGVEGIMRGVQLGRMTIEPVSYDPVNNILRVFNDIEVEVSFDGADAVATEEMLVKTYSPHFDVVYKQLFNYRAIADAYTDHPDLYNTPVRMLVICYSGFQGNSALNEWLQWKLQKGYYFDIYYTNETGTTASAIASFIKTKYNASVSAGNAYTYLIVIGDTGQVPQYMTKTVSYACASDLGYSSVNFSSSTSNYFPDMYYSRMSVENTTHLTNYLNKVLTYEKFEFTDGGNYLNNVILVGGWDSSWTSKVAKPTINYATNNYFKANNTTYGGFENGTINATVSTSSTEGYSGSNNGCYNGINNGVCFLNYTAHGDRQEWYQPQMTAAHVATLTNTGKYFFGVGNCCLTGNFNNTTTTYSPGSAIGTNACFAEAMIRVPNAGAVAYVGCSPYSYWYEDFYWAVGAHSYSAGNAPSVSSSSKGVYDVMFDDGNWNSASALNYLGNLAVQQAVTNNNTTSNITSGNCNNSAHYYFQFYHTFGDGSVMPYITKPEANTVAIPGTVASGTTSITVNAMAGSYVAVTDNNSVIYGVAEANSSGVATVNFTNAIPNNGTLNVVVTRQQYQPYFGTINVENDQTSEYTINVSADPANGGTVTGGGTFSSGSSRTVVATANTGYTFTNWTENGTVVSTSANYTFTLNYNRNLVANFTINSYNVTATPVPVEGGTVAFGGRGNREELVYDFEDGWQGWTTFQGNTTSPNSWMHNTAYPTSNNNFTTGYGYNGSDGFMLSESYISGSSSGTGTAVTPDNYLVSPQVRLGGSVSFYAGARNPSYCAEKFSVMVSTTDNTNAASFTTVGTWTLSLSQAGFNSTPYTVDLSAYSGMGYIAIRHHDCNDQWFLAVDNVTIMEGEVEDASISGTFNYGESCTLVATPNADYHFVNWTENGISVSSSAAYTFTVTGDRDLVANFSDAVVTIEESFDLGEGWNWWSPNMSITLQELEEALGTYGVKIAAQNGKFVTYNTNNGSWSGNLTSIELGKMYKIKTNAACSISFSGEIVDPAEYPIVLSHGNNWIGFIGTESMSLEQALSGITPTDRDVIKSSTGKATYYEGYGWQGTLHTLEPGVGYVYKSNATNAKHFTYPSGN